MTDSSSIRCLLCLLAISGVLHARVVSVTLWISGGADGVIMGGREAPGWLGVSRHITDQDEQGMWLDIGGTTDWTQLAEVEGLRMPDTVVPSVFRMQHLGVEGLRNENVPWTLLNVGLLPQFPEEEVPFPPSRSWEQEDGIRIRVVGVLPEDAPLRIPPSQLRPLKVMPPLPAVRNDLIGHKDPNAFRVVVLPEGVNAKEWSRGLPGIPVLVEPPGKTADVIALDDGNQIRVRPALNGRSIIRVDVRWDTVAKTYRRPHATVEWVSVPELGGVTLPPPLVKRLRPLPEQAPVEYTTSMLSEADLMLLPQTGKADRSPHRLIDRKRIAVVPENQVWMEWELTASEASDIQKLTISGADWHQKGSRRGSKPVRVWIPAEWAAGKGGETLALRQFLDRIPTTPKVQQHTTREIRVPLQTSP